MDERDNPPTDPGDELPTYQNLEAEANAEGGATAARWNRWRGWIEKRAAERYADGSSQARRLTGWGESSLDDQDTSPSPAGSRERPKRQDTQISLPPPDYALPEPAGSPGQRLDPSRLSLHTFGSRFLPHATDRMHCVLPILQDRFLLIGSAQGLSVLDVHPSLHPRKGEQPLSLTTTTSTQPLVDALGIPIWIGEAVYQLDILEDANSDVASETPQGVVLALVGPADDDCNRCLRMYNLGSLSSLVRWYVAQQDHPPIDLQKTGPSAQNSGSSTNRQRLRKLRPQSELSKGLKSLIVDELKVSSSTASPGGIPERSRSPTQLTSPTTSPPRKGPGISPYQSNAGTLQPTLSTTSTLTPLLPAMASASNSSLNSSAWDVVDELPLRWATDYIAFATPNSRLSNVAVSFYEIRKSKDGKTPTYLAVATRTNILLYETPRDERAFKFVKEFYTPLPAKSVSFIQQSDPTPPSGSKERSGQPSLSNGVQELHRRNSSGHPTLSRRRGLKGNGAYGIQLCLFVAFEKKAGLIRVGDAAVTEVDPFPDIALTMSSSHRSRPSLPSFTPDSMPPGGSASLRRHLVQSLDGQSFWKSHPPWLPLRELFLPLLAPPSAAPSPLSPNSRPWVPPDSICFITRGRTTQIYPVPLPMSFGNASGTSRPWKYVTWQYQPTRIHARVSHATATEGETTLPPPPFLQVIAFGEHGVEVQELSLDFIWQSPNDVGKDNGKSKATISDIVVRAFGDVGGPAGLLYVGGQWDKPIYNSPVDIQSSRSPTLSRQDTWATVDSYTATSPYGTSTSSHVTARLNVEVGLGVYGWVMKGAEDWRVFWLGEGATS